LITTATTTIVVVVVLFEAKIRRRRFKQSKWSLKFVLLLHIIQDYY